MSETIVAVFPVKEDQVEMMEGGFRASLGDTRGFEGCINLDVHFDETTSTFVVIQEWESIGHYDRYLDWRKENGLMETFDRLLVDGRDGFKVHRLKAKPDL